MSWPSSCPVPKAPRHVDGYELDVLAGLAALLQLFEHLLRDQLIMGANKQRLQKRPIQALVERGDIGLQCVEPVPAGDWCSTDPDLENCVGELFGGCEEGEGVGIGSLGAMLVNSFSIIWGPDGWKGEWEWVHRWAVCPKAFANDCVDG